MIHFRTYNDSSDWNFENFQEIASLLYDVTADGGVVGFVRVIKLLNGSESGTSFFKQALYFPHGS